MQSSQQTEGTRWPVTAALLLAVFTLAATSIFSVQVLSAVRAYVSGESLWSKGQKDASFSLLRYSETRDPADFAQFEKAVSIPLGDRVARLALDAAVPDRVAAGLGFLQGGNQPDDVEAMIDLFLRFRNVGFMARAIDIWVEADAELDRFLLIGTQLRDAVRAGSRGPEFESMRDRLRESNARLTLIEQRFSDSLGQASRSAQRIVTLLTVGLATLLAVGGALLIRSAFGRLAKVERSLRDSNDRWAIAAQAAKVELFDWDLSTDVVTSYLASGVLTTQYADFLASLPEDDRSRLQEAVASARATKGRFSSDQRRRRTDGSEQWANVLGQFSYDADGEPYRMLGVRVDITERKINETRLQEWKDRYEATIKASRQILYDWNLKDDQVAFAGDVQGILGYRPVELTGTLSQWVERVHIDDRPRVAAQLQHVAQDGGHLDGVEYRVQRKDGEWATVVHDGHFQQRMGGEPPHGVGFISNITERKLAQAALQESEQRYRTLWETAPDTVVVLDETGRIEYANAALTRTFGWATEEMIGQNIERLQPPHLRLAHRSGVARYLRTGEHRVDWRATEAIGLHRDGHEFAIEVSFSHTVVNGKHIFAGFLRDIGARKKSEADRDRLADFVEKSLNEVYVFNADTFKLEYANAAGRDNLGRSMPDLKEMTPADFSPAFALDAYRSLLRPLLEGTDKQVGYETEHLRFDGSRYPAQVTVQFVGQAANGVLLATALDVTERVAADAARKVLLEQLRQSQKMESLGTLAGGIAHDFNNIVGGVLGNVALARHDLQPDHPARESIDQINKAALRARELVNQILAFSRQQALKLVDQPLQPIVMETMQLLRASLPASVELEVELPDQPVHVRADATQIQQVLMNLCTNAWHACKGVEARISVRVDTRVIARDEHHSTDGLPPGTYARFSVSDTGIGMNAATRARIFEPFFTTRPVGEGTGLGLSVVHGIIAAHEGAITVDSEVGRGTTLHVYLALQATPIEDAAGAPATLSDVMSGRGEHLLYVDDDEVMLLMVERLLHRAGYRVTAMGDANAAIETLIHDPSRFDLVLTDFNMPGVSGLQIARSVAQMQPQLPVVILSGDISNELSEEAAELGVAAVVPKQHAFERLAGVVRRLLDASREGIERPSAKHAKWRNTMRPPTPVPQNERRRLARLRELAILDTAPEPVFDAITKLASEICGTPIALLTMVDQERQWFKANVGLSDVKETPRDIAFCAHAVIDDAVFVVPDAMLDPRFADNPLVTGEPNIRFYAGAPLLMPGGERIGSLCVIDRQARSLSEEQIQRLRALAEIASKTLVMRSDLMNQFTNARRNVNQITEPAESTQATKD